MEDENLEFSLRVVRTSVTSINKKNWNITTYTNKSLAKENGVMDKNEFCYSSHDAIEIEIYNNQKSKI